MIATEAAARLRVLVVDDCPDTTTSFCLLLSMWGYEVRVANDGPTALEVALTFQPDIALLDLSINHTMDGFELAGRLRSTPDLESMILICVTGHGRDDDRHQSHLAGFDHHFLKPVDLDELHEFLADVKIAERWRRDQDAACPVG